MKPTSKILSTLLLTGIMGSAVATAKPLKVYILVGQSNMEGHAHVNTFRGLGMEPGAEPELLKAMTNEDGSPREIDDVRISLCTKDVSGNSLAATKAGKLTVGYGAQYGALPKIGPEYTFGISMQKHLHEPILIIKAAWGGRSLNTNYRPPSAGPYVFNEQAKKKFGGGLAAKEEERRRDTGVYYRLMIDHVKNVLSDPGKVHPAYNPEVGYELAGFVWFQGWNDSVDTVTYPDRDKPGGYNLYAELLAHLIRDVRKDLNAPNMPFVIGVMGIGGVATKESAAKETGRYAGMRYNFQSAMAKPASMPEFKDNVIAVQTGECWDPVLAELSDTFWRITNDDLKVALEKLGEERKGGKISAEEREALRQSMLKKEMGDRYEYWTANQSNQGYHYFGSAKILGRIGKAFADALADWHENH